MNISRRHNISSLKKKNEIDLVFKYGEKKHTKLGPVFLHNDRNNEMRKVAVLVKKHVGSSVNRNYIKRIIRYFITHHSFILDNHNRIIFLFNRRKPVEYSKLKEEYLRVLLK